MRYNIIRQKRKTATIIVDDSLDVIIKVPGYMKMAEIDKLIEKHSLVIHKMIEQKRVHGQQNNWRLTNKILYLGKYKMLQVIPTVSGKESISIEEDTLIIKSLDTADNKKTAELIETFYRDQAKIILTKFTDYYAAMLGVTYHKISIRKQKTRWGSCSDKGSLSYNVKLMCAPEEMIAYVALHEVMHLKHFNHSYIFWQELAIIMPDYKQKMNYFKQFGQNFII